MPHRQFTSCRLLTMPLSRFLPLGGIMSTRDSASAACCCKSLKSANHCCVARVSTGCFVRQSYLFEMYGVQCGVQLEATA